MEEGRRGGSVLSSDIEARSGRSDLSPAYFYKDTFRMGIA